MQTVTGGTWLAVSEGCELRCYANDETEACLTVTQSGIEHELSLDYPSMRVLVEQATVALARMEEGAQPRKPVSVTPRTK